MKKISLFALSLLLGSIILSSCNNANTSKQATQNQSTFDLTVAKKEIEEANRNFMDLVAKGDSTGLANAYTTDAKFMNAGAPSSCWKRKYPKSNVRHCKISNNKS